MKRARIVRFIIFGLIVTFASKWFFVSNVFAEENMGSWDTAWKKLLFTAVHDCIDKGGGTDKIAGKHEAAHGWWYRINPSSGGLTDDYYWTSSDLLEGQWFSSWGQGNADTTGPGTYLEYLVHPDEGSPDGKLWCGENENKLLKEIVFGGTKPLNLTTEYVICGDNKYGGQNGIMGWDTDAGDCMQNLHDSNKRWFHYYLYKERSDYWYEMVADKAFNNNVPAGSLWELTDLEGYFLKRKSFETTCADSNNIGSSGYKVWDYDGKKWKEVSWYAKKGEDTEVIYFHWQKEKCKDLAWDMHEGHNFEAYRDYLNEKAEEECEKEYDAMLENVIGKYILDYYKAYMYGKNFVRTIEGMFSEFPSDEKYLLSTVYDGNSSTDSRIISSSVIEGLTEYIDNQLSQVVNAKINGETLFKENAFKQLAEAAKSVLSQTEIGGELAEGTGWWEVKSTVDDLGPLQEWIDEANAQLATIDKNRQDMVAFRQEKAGNEDLVSYEEDGVNMQCKGKEELANDWSNFKKNLPGAPDIDGSFDPSAYIDPNSVSPGTSGPPEVKLSCANSGGAESLGWIVCPLLEWMGHAADEVYSKYVEPSLQIKTKLFSEDNDQGTKFGWGVFQGIANVLFVILFMVVIFSQLTGYGIDNYGIKKILPKLIVVAILVNLSYYICLICVDLSNILGNGLQALFNGLPISGSPTLTIPDSDITGRAVDTTALTGVAVLGILVVMFGMVWKNPAILLSLLVAALGVVIAIFFLFVLLAAREAAIVILVVVSPIAFACYTLPNTKKFFDKWLKFGEGLLLVYPIAGALVGGGDYVSRLLLSSGFAGGGFIAAFTAMIVGVLPIFFIPTVLKGAFAAIGSIGAKISGFGDRMRGKTTSKLRSTEGYKAAQVRSQARKNRIKAGLDRNYKPTAIGNMKARVARSRFGRAVGYAGLQNSRVKAAKKAQAEGIEGETALRNLQLEYENNRRPNMSTENYLRNQLEDAVNSGNEDSIFAVIDQMRGSNMQASHIAQATRSILGSRTMNKNFLERFAKTYGGDFLKKDFEQLDWARKGGISSSGANVALVGAGEQWMQSNIAIDDMKDEDVAALSSDRLADFIAAGKITQPQAQRVWAANGNMDDTNRLMLGAYGSEGRVLTKAQAQSELTNPTIMSAEQVAAYTERAATNTVIEDVRLRDAQGRHSQTDRLGVEGEFHVEHNSSDPVREARRLREEELRAEGFGPGDPEWNR